MAWYDEDSWLTAAFAPKPLTIVVTLLITILLPILLHQFLYRQAAPTALPTFLLVGPSGAGKTALLTLVSSRPSLSILFAPSPNWYVSDGAQHGGSNAHVDLPHGH
jgi:signal recognition particle receptor subunit beta